MEPYTYFLHALRRDPKWGLIEFFPGVQRDYNLDKGVRMGSDFPPTVELMIAPGSGNIITDFISNVGGIPIVSARARRVLEEAGLKGDDVEYLPFVLKNQKGRVVEGEGYCVVNPLRKVECLDRKRSKYKARSDGVTVVVMEVCNLLVERIPPDAKLFRLAELPEIILFRSDLVKALQDAGLTGLTLRSPGENLRV